MRRDALMFGIKKQAVLANRAKLSARRAVVRQKK